MQILTAKIREWATKKGMSLSSAISSLGVSPSVFYNWEKGGNPTPTTLAKMAERMQVDVSELVITSRSDASARSAHSHSSENIEEHLGGVILVSMPRVVYNDMKGILRRCGARVVGHLTSNEVTPSLTQNQQAAA